MTWSVSTTTPTGARSSRSPSTRSALASASAPTAVVANLRRRPGGRGRVARAISASLSDGCSRRSVRLGRTPGSVCRVALGSAPRSIAVAGLGSSGPPMSGDGRAARACRMAPALFSAGAGDRAVLGPFGRPRSFAEHGARNAPRPSRSSERSRRSTKSCGRAERTTLASAPSSNDRSVSNVWPRQREGRWQRSRAWMTCHPRRRPDQSTPPPKSSR